ncbi:response regulator [Fulvivirga sedimenti]|uniref:Response regulator n=1 Tax=Fulvivirga sedimenti TaxID=2879465 RepID=A0A9X1L264_9BACT|nr:response regulator [Fulvivirga sedimenti]MCA6075486.1 response regulator [Fulvivirga sedimenti]MCA6076663.1 response regulator [Fulvivirga sedimenti]MCA6077791.1 response regulator [Fulvivirga sedimenti]
MIPTKNNLIFVVDDDAYFNGLLTAFVKRISTKAQIPVTIQSFESGEACMAHLHLNPSVILLDFYLDSCNDITSTAYDLLSDIHKTVPDAYILIVSQQEDWSMFKQDLISSGASEFLQKDRDLEDNLTVLLTDRLK